MLCGPNRDASDDLGKANRPVSRSNNQINPRTVGTSQNRTEIVWILDAIQDQNKRTAATLENIAKISFRNRPLTRTTCAMLVGSGARSGLLPGHQVRGQRSPARIRSLPTDADG